MFETLGLGVPLSALCASGNVALHGPVGVPRMQTGPGKASSIPIQVNVADLIIVPPER